MTIDPIMEALKSIFSNGNAQNNLLPMAQWKDSDNVGIDIQIARGMLFVLAFLLCYALMGMIGGKWYYQLPGGIAGAYLLISFILPGELYAAMVTYSAAGLALTIALPIFILLIFTGQMLSKDDVPKPAQVILERFVWLFFFIFLVYKIIAYVVGGQAVYDKGVLIIMGVSCLLSAGVFFFHHWYLMIVGKTLGSAYSSVFTTHSMNVKRKLLNELEDKEKEIRKLDTKIGKAKNEFIKSSLRAQKDVLKAQIKELKEQAGIRD